jgi:AraC family transcriptional regulator
MGSSARMWFQDRGAQPFPAEIIGEADNLRVSFISDRPGIVEFGGSPAVVISIHVGPSVEVDCRRGGERHRGRTIHGDIEIIPPRLPGVWELGGSDSALVLGLGLRAVHRVVEEFGGDPSRFRVTNRFQARDARIEHIGWALKAEMEAGYPCGRMYTDGLATALAAALVRNHSSLARPAREPHTAMPARTLKCVLAYIEDNLSRDLGLREIAGVAGLSVSQFKVQFRKSVGVPPHQHLIRRRVERAATLLRRGKTSIAQVALETGFCHQSHLAAHMRRVLGVTPREVKNGELNARTGVR